MYQFIGPRKYYDALNFYYIISYPGVYEYSGRSRYRTPESLNIVAGVGDTILYSTCIELWKIQNEECLAVYGCFLVLRLRVSTQKNTVTTTSSLLLEFIWYEGPEQKVFYLF